MNDFEYLAPTNVDDAVGRLGPAARAYAGGTDLLTRMRLGLDSPAVLVDLKRTDLGRTIDPDDGGWTIGALATLSDVEDHAALAADHPLLAEAAGQAATRQIRNRASVGGNLVQRPRCAYYREPVVTCWLKGGAECPARAGEHQHHAVVDSGPCIAVHPSDLAACLVAVDASISLRADGGTRTIAADALFQPPTEDRRRLTSERDGEVVTAVHLPPADGVHSTYRKAMDRAAWAFALVGAAVVVRVVDGVTTSARIVLAGVASTPHREVEAEAALTGRPLDAAAIAGAAGAVLASARPLPGNRYKVALARGLVTRGLHALAADIPS